MKDFMLTILEDDEYRLHVAVAEAFGSGEDGGAPSALSPPARDDDHDRPSERSAGAADGARPGRPDIAAGEEAGFELAAYAARSEAENASRSRPTLNASSGWRSAARGSGSTSSGRRTSGPATSPCGRPGNSAFSARRHGAPARHRRDPVRRRASRRHRRAAQFRRGPPGRPLTEEKKGQPDGYPHRERDTHHSRRSPRIRRAAAAERARRRARPRSASSRVLACRIIFRSFRRRS